jgi:hypothetical protein
MKTLFYFNFFDTSLDEKIRLFDAFFTCFLFYFHAGDIFTLLYLLASIPIPINP